MNPNPGLNAGLLVAAENVVPVSQGLAIPGAGIQVEDSLSLGRKVRISWKDPVAESPRLDGCTVQNTPHRTATDGTFQRRRNTVRDVGRRLPRQRNLGLSNDFARDGFDLRLFRGGKSEAAVLNAADPRRRSRHGPTGDATSEPTGPRAPRHWPRPGWEHPGSREATEPEWPAARDDAPPSSARPVREPAARTREGTVDETAEASTACDSFRIHL